MSKNVQSVKNSLKFKAAEKSGVLSVKVGVKKYTLPVTARMLSNGEFLFLSFPASSELYKVNGKTIVAMDKAEDATEAHKLLDPGKRPRGTKAAATSDIPAELVAALKGIPSGMKLVYDKGGNPKLVKARKRRAKA